MFSVSLKEIVDKFCLDIITGQDRLADILITNSAVNRPGLQLTGYMKYFGVNNIQIIGKIESAYLGDLPSKERQERLEYFFSYKFPCMIVSKEVEITPAIIEASNKHGVPILKSNLSISKFSRMLTQYLTTQLAPRTTKHGCFVEVHGEGVLIFGESGVGKSETVLELVKRGHRLVADDVVEIKKVSSHELVGAAPDLIRHFIEIRGIGVVDVKNLYGVGAVKISETIDLVINLEFWDQEKNYDRLGLEEERIDILGVKVPYLSTPVRPGRNLAIIIEVAAINNRQKKMGYNAAATLNQRTDNRNSQDGPE